MKKLMLSATMVAMMVTATAAPAFASHLDDFEGGDVDQTGGSLRASNSLVQQGQNFFNIQNQVAAEVDQDQNVNQQANQTITVTGADDVNIDAELNQSAEQNADVGNVNIEDVHLSTAQAIAVSR